MALPAANGAGADADHNDAHAFDVGSDSDDSGWLIEESRINFSEQAGYTLCVSGRLLTAPPEP